uniref:Uncharacterized protein n=1 Tax=Panagrolaimus sp. ES5 TaxID=591445 RepID=A0AC34G5M6_9BILA
MPRLPAGKLKQKDNMLKNRKSYEPKSNDAEAGQEPLPPAFDNPLPLASPPSEEPLNDPKSPLSEEHSKRLKNMSKAASDQRLLQRTKKQVHKNQMKAARYKQLNDLLNVTKQEDVSSSDSDYEPDSDGNGSDSNGDSSDFFDRNIPVIKITESDVANLPEPQINELVTPYVPSPPKSTRPLKDLQHLSPSQKHQRIKKMNITVAETLGPDYQVIHKTKIPGQLSLHDAASYKVLNHLTDQQYDKLDRKRYPSLSNLKQYLKELLLKLKDQRKNGLAEFIINDINSLKEFPFEDARINFGVDQGTDSVKIVVSYPDLPDSQSAKKLRVYKAFYGTETRTELEPYIDEINFAAKFLQHALIETKHGFKRCICFFIADCKCGDVVLGIQGGSSLRPCINCTIPSSEWGTLQTIPADAFRTVEDIQKAGLIIEKAEQESSLSVTKMRSLKQQQNSVNATPLITEIPLNRFVPDAVHINMAAVNSIIQYCKKRPELATILLAEIENINVQYNPGRSEYNGPNCSKVLKHFVDNPNLDGYGIDLLRSYSKVEAYAVARDLTEEEINGLDQAIKDFFALIAEKYPDLPGKKTKLHMLKHHVMPFVREHKSWGKFSAQALEASHKVKNLSDKRIQGATPLVKV